MAGKHEIKTTGDRPIAMAGRRIAQEDEAALDAEIEKNITLKINSTSDFHGLMQ